MNGMLTISRRADGPTPTAAPAAPPALLELPFETRCKSRFRAALRGGEPVAVFLARGQILRGGDRLLGDDGRVVQVRAAAELVSTAHGTDAAQLLRVAYHLGNRHVALQVGGGWLRYLHDHVLDAMVQGLGLDVQVEQAPFEPEAGAYAAAHATHGQAGGHGHAHDHSHGQEPEHLHEHPPAGPARAP
jgi:urease accessory protein